MRSSLALLALLVGCGNGVHGLDFVGKPIVTIHGRVDRGTLPLLDTDDELVAGIAWSAPPYRDPVCGLATTNPRVIELCGTPEDFLLGTIQPETVRLPPGDRVVDFDLPLYLLPDPTASFGSADARIAYGSLVVLEPVDFDIPVDVPVTPAIGEDLFSMLPVAASYASGDEFQQRLLFREGDFDATASGYPAGCQPPPQGYAVLENDPGVDCTLLGVESRIVSGALTSEEAEKLVCPAALGGFVLPPEEGVLPEGGLECVNGDVLLAVQVDICTSYLVYALSGCGDDLFCDEPEWDRRANPPTWWPCP